MGTSLGYGYKSGIWVQVWDMGTSLGYGDKSSGICLLKSGTCGALKLMFFMEPEGAPFHFCQRATVYGI